MALQTSGIISIDDIRVELNKTGTTSLQDTDVRGLVDKNQGETISLDDFYGAVNLYEVFVTADAANLDASAYAVANGWDGTTPLVFTVNAGVWLYSNTTATGGLVIPSSMNGLIALENYGNIVGQGGGATSAGGPAISNSATGVVINNYSGAFIAGGGGGGGGSQGGGGAGQAAPGQAGAVGGAYTSSAGVSSSIGPFGCSEGGTFYIYGSCSVTVNGSIGAGGQQGASAGSGSTTGGCCTTVFSGSSGTGCSHSQTSTICGGGGALNPGGQGGSILSASSNQTVSGGGWGLQGAGGGGAGGAAVAGTTVTMSNSGTLYGTVA
jgi:hypothetical protein